MTSDANTPTITVISKPTHIRKPINMREAPKTQCLDLFSVIVDSLPDHMRNNDCCYADGEYYQESQQFYALYYVVNALQYSSVVSDIIYIFIVFDSFDY